MSVAELDREAIRARCTRSVSHDPPRRDLPQARFAQLAALTPPDALADVYGQGKVIQAFEEHVAGLLGKEAAVFMPSGTMAQQIALRIWADRRHLNVVAFHPKCHLEQHEERGYARLHGLDAKLVGPLWGLITLGDLQRLAEPISVLLLELPQRDIGGQLPLWDDLVAIAEWARARGVALHLDGARLWETQPFYGHTYSEITALFDSVYVSLYKIMNGLAGCILAGTADFIAEARIWQRRHGGVLVHLYPYVHAAQIGLTERLGKMSVYRDKAVEIAARLSQLPGIDVIPNPPHTNMMHLAIRAEIDRLTRAALEVSSEKGVWLFGKAARTDLPSYQRVELVVSEGALEIETEEIGTLFEQVIDRARRT